MSGQRIYFDHNATSPLRPEARAAMLAALDQAGNASSVHGEGRAARRIVEDAREQVAALAGAEPAGVVFTSGATEANNIALAGGAAGGWQTIIVAGVEHESVQVPAAACAASVVRLPVAGDGRVDLGALAEAALLGAAVGERTLLTLQMANNETGVCQDLAAAAAFAREHAIATHTDAVQAFGRLPVDVAALGVDLMSVSSHKIGGPMGVGALIVRDGFPAAKLIRGGGQERGRRAGTENVAAIAGFGAAAAAARAGLEVEAVRLAGLRDRLEAMIVDLVPGVVIIGAGADRLPNTLSVAFPGERAETLVIKFDLTGVAVSAGSACSSGKVGASHVMTAMGLPAEIAQSAIRLSMGWNTTERCLEEFSTRFHRLQFRPAEAAA